MEPKSYIVFTNCIPALKVDERQRLARERRVEQEKLLGKSYLLINQIASLLMGCHSTILLSSELYRSPPQGSNNINTATL